VALLSRGNQESRWSVCYRLVSIAMYYIFVMRLSAVYVMLSAQLLLVVFDLAYNLSSEYLQFTLDGPLHYNKRYSI